MVHFCDWHFVPKGLCELDGINFDDVCETAGVVQKSELAIARRLVNAHGLKAVYSEGFTDMSKPPCNCGFDALKDLRPLTAAEEAEAVKHLTLEVGAPGRLWLARDIADVLPLEDEKALQDAKPVADGKIVF